MVSKDCDMKLIQPELGAEELKAIESVFASGALSQGPAVNGFEAVVSNYVGTQYGISTSSCTTALHLILSALGIKPGDEVIVPDFTFPATANVVLQIGATPILVDIDPVTFTLDPSAFETAITDRTRAVIPVHTFGLCADMRSINEIANRHGIYVIEDAACALGAEMDGNKAGNLGTVAAFSFHPRKIVTTGEGGMITTNDSVLAEKMRILSSHGGRRIDNVFVFEESGYNYRMSDINAAIGIVQMTKLDEIVARRREIADLYDEALGSIVGIQEPIAPSRFIHTYQSYVIRLDESFDRDLVMKIIRQAGIEVTIGTYSICSQPYMSSKKQADDFQVDNSRRAFRSTITLPLYSGMQVSDVEKVAMELEKAINFSACA